MLLGPAPLPTEAPSKLECTGDPGYAPVCAPALALGPHLSLHPWPPSLTRKFSGRSSLGRVSPIHLRLPLSHKPGYFGWASQLALGPWQSRTTTGALAKRLPRGRGGAAGRTEESCSRPAWTLLRPSRPPSQAARLPRLPVLPCIDPLHRLSSAPEFARFPDAAAPSALRSAALPLLLLQEAGRFGRPGRGETVAPSSSFPPPLPLPAPEGRGRRVPAAVEAGRAAAHSGQ